MNRYNVGRSQGQIDVKNNPNGYGLYTVDQYNANYNSGRTQGQNDVKNNPSTYGIAVSPSSLSGSGVLWVADGWREFTATVTFSTAFYTTPSINFSASSDRPTECEPSLIYIKSATKAGFVVANRASNPGYATINFYWNAVV